MVLDAVAMTVEEGGAVMAVAVEAAVEAVHLTRGRFERREGDARCVALALVPACVS